MSREGSEWDRARFLSSGEDWWPPHQVRLELVEGCHLRCHSCGIAGIRRDKWDVTTRLMDRDIPRMVATELIKSMWPATVVLTGRGEPALHPQIDDVISDMRDISKGTAIMMETSGHGLVDVRLARHETLAWRFVNRVNSLMECGLTVMSLSRREDTAQIWDLVDDVAEDAAALLGSRLERHYLHHVPNGYDRVLVLLRDVQRVPLTQTPEERATSHCGAGAQTWPRHGDYRRRGNFCARPAQELVVRYDGLVTMCQEDWRGQVILGDLRELSMYEIWYSEAARAARARAMAGLRDLAPCSKCDWQGDRRMRIGAEHLVTKPTPAHARAIRAATLPKSATTQYRRLWER